MIKKYLLMILIITLPLAAENCFAVVQDERFWPGVFWQKPLSDDQKWLAVIFSQLRFINDNHPLQTALLEGGIGYKLVDDKTIWFGYRVSAQNPTNNSHQENRLFQQLIWQITPQKQHKLISRSRLEEIQRSDQSETSVRFRERMGIEINRPLFVKHLLPYIYDEAFFQLNKTSYTSKQFINQNRLFIGFNYYCSEKSWWEIGYMSQFQRHPSPNPSTLSHVLSLTYYFS